MALNSRVTVRAGSESFNPRATPFYPSSFGVVPEGNADDEVGDANPSSSDENYYHPYQQFNPHIPPHIFPQHHYPHAPPQPPIPPPNSLQLSSSQHQAFPPYGQGFPSLICSVKVSNFDNKTDQSTFQELLDSIIATFSVDDGTGIFTSGLDYELIQYTSGTEKSPAKTDTDDDDDDDDDNETNDNVHKTKSEGSKVGPNKGIAAAEKDGAISGNANEPDEENEDAIGNKIPQALIQVTWPLAYKLIEALHGYEWHGRSLEAIIISNSPARPYAAPPYLPLDPAQQLLSGVSASSALTSATASSSGATSTRSSRQNSTSGSSSYYNAYHQPYNGAYGQPSYDYQNHYMPHYTHIHSHGPAGPPPSISHLPGWADYSSLNSAGTPPRNYLSRRPSNRSIESFSKGKQHHHHHQQQQQQQQSNIQRSSSLTSSSSGAAGLPPFILNLVNSNHSNQSVSNESPDLSATAEDSESTTDSSFDHHQHQHHQYPGKNEAIIITNEEGQPIKVNPKRLFVGNIPFSSTWCALKNFLVSKSEEIEPGNNIEILRVEIPMSPQSNVKSSYNGVNEEYNFDNDLKHRQDANPGGSRGMSRGFAIVTTGNQDSSEKLIKYFDEVEFEGRKLTVRFDKFPDFNNYLLQQLYPFSKNNAGNHFNNHNGNTNMHHNGNINNTNLFGLNGISKSFVLSNLAFERNSFQQKFYYGAGGGGAAAAAANYPSGGNSSSPHSMQMPMMYNTNHYYNNPVMIGSTAPPLINPVNMPPPPSRSLGTSPRPSPNQLHYSFSQPQLPLDGSVSPQSETVNPTNASGTRSEKSKSQLSSMSRYSKAEAQSHVRPPKPAVTSHSAKQSVLNPSSRNNSAKQRPRRLSVDGDDNNINDDEKARELVNSFKSLGISS